MPMSLKVMLKKFVHKGQITQEEYDALIKKLDGHDKEIRNNAIDEFAEKLKKELVIAYLLGDGSRAEVVTSEMIDEIAEQLKEE